MIDWAPELSCQCQLTLDFEFVAVAKLAREHEGLPNVDVEH